MLKLSCIVPCYPPHVKYLEQCFNEIKNQSLLPNEVILSISETTDEESNEIYLKYEKIFKNINVEFIIVNTTSQQYAGINRNMGVKKSNGDVIVFVDCDDFLHPEKFQITMNYMEKSNCDLIIHSFVWNKPSDYFKNLSESIESDKILIIETTKIYNDNFPTNYVRNRNRELKGKVPVVIHSNDKNIIYHIHAGFITCKKKIFDYISYTSRPRGEDCLFLRDCIYHKFNVVYLFAELINYIH